MKYFVLLLILTAVLASKKDWQGYLEKVLDQSSTEIDQLYGQYQELQRIKLHVNADVYNRELEGIEKGVSKYMMADVKTEDQLKEIF